MSRVQPREFKTALRYRPQLHTVRRVKDADFKNGTYRIAAGQFVACSGAWDRKGMITKVHLPTIVDKATGRCGVKVDVVFIGHYFAAPSERVLNPTRHTYNYDTHESRYTPRSFQSQMRFRGKTYVQPAKLSKSTTTIWFDKDGKLRHRYNGWVVVLPR